MFAKLSKSEQLMFVSDDLLIPSTQIAHDFGVLRLDMPMKVWPAKASYIAVSVWAVVAEQ